MSWTSSGVRVTSSDVIRLLMQTLLPEPVAPATSRCGMRARSPTMGLPETSMPIAIGSLARANCGELIRSPSLTRATEVLGTSMPTIGRPGTGASTRRVGAPRRRARSFWRWTMRLTATPGAGFSPNWVMAGPCWTSTTCASTLNEASVSSMMCARALSSAGENAPASVARPSTVGSGFCHGAWSGSRRGGGGAPVWAAVVRPGCADRG